MRWLSQLAANSECWLQQHNVPLLRKTTSEPWCLSGGKREDYQKCSVLYCVLKLCTVISTLRWAVLTVLCIGFCHTGHISLCVDSFVFICVYFVCFCFILHRCCIILSTVGWTSWDWSLILRTYLLSVLWHWWVIWSVKTCPRYDLWCVLWDVKPCSIYLSTATENALSLIFHDSIPFFARLYNCQNDQKRTSQADINQCQYAQHKQCKAQKWQQMTN